MSLTPEVSEEELFSADEEDEGEGFEDPYSAFEARAAAANMAAQSSHGSVDEGIGGSDSSQPRGTHAFDEEDCDFSPRKAPKKRRASTSSNSSAPKQQRRQREWHSINRFDNDIDSEAYIRGPLTQKVRGVTS